MFLERNHCFKVTDKGQHCTFIVWQPNAIALFSSECQYYIYASNYLSIYYIIYILCTIYPNRELQYFASWCWCIAYIVNVNFHNYTIGFNACIKFDESWHLKAFTIMAFNTPEEFNEAGIEEFISKNILNDSIMFCVSCQCSFDLIHFYDHCCLVCLVTVTHALDRNTASTS